jgi:hypothetical protein
MELISGDWLPGLLLYELIRKKLSPDKKLF